MPITALYAGLLAPLYIFLALRVIDVRRGVRIAVGDGGNALLLRRMRVHANFAEYVPFTLVLLGLAESLGTDRLLLHALGIALLVARILHAIGMSQPREILGLRVAGVATTLAVLGVAAFACLFGAVRGGF